MIIDLKKVIAGLKYWNIHLENPTYDQNFQSRLKLQKLTYLCKALGMQLDNYNFSLYKFGPYCPDLTDDYYDHAGLVINLESDYNPKQKEREIFDKIKIYVLSHPLNKEHQTDLLEAITTVLYIKQHNPDYLDDDLFEKTKFEKPYLSDKIIMIAINIVKKLLFKPEYLTDELKEELDMWDRAED